jgi:hypothetical protein
MASNLKAGDLRQILAKAGANWTIDGKLNDNDPIRTYATGGDLTKAIKATSVPRINVTPYFQMDTSNPYLRQIRVNQGFLRLEDLPVDLRQPITLNEAVFAPKAPAAGGPAPGGAGASASVDEPVRMALADADQGSGRV